MAKIELTRGYWTEIDDTDLPFISSFKWHVFISGRTAYARTYIPNPDVSASRRNVYLHRYLLDAPSGVTVDHINGDGLDNRRSNLRLATQGQNNRNIRKREAETSSRYKGVSVSRDSWRACVVVGGVGRSMGNFSTEYEAAMAYDAMALAAYSDFANTNFTAEEHARHRHQFPAFWEMLSARVAYLNAKDLYEGRVTRNGRIIPAERDVLRAYLGEET